MNSTSTHLAAGPDTRFPRWFEDVAVVLTAGTGSLKVPKGLRKKDVLLSPFDQALHTGEARERKRGMGAGVAAINIMDGHQHRPYLGGCGLPGLRPDAVTSVLSPRTRVYFMDPEAPEFPRPAHGLHAPAVFRAVYATGDEVITAGLAVGVPDCWADPDDPAADDKDGVIYHHAGRRMGPKRCGRIMREMVTGGMDGIRDGAGKWTYYQVTATSYHDPDIEREARCATALLLFLDEASEKHYAPVLIPARLAA